MPKKSNDIFFTVALRSAIGKYDGIWTVQDRMHHRWVRRIDLLVDNHISYGKWYDVKIELLK